MLVTQAREEGREGVVVREVFGGYLLGHSGRRGLGGWCQRETLPCLQCEIGNVGARESRSWVAASWVKRGVGYVELSFRPEVNPPSQFFKVHLWPKLHRADPAFLVPVPAAFRSR